MIIDITNELLTEIKSTLSVDVFTEYPKAKAKFPVIIFTEQSNVSDLDTVDSGGENCNLIYFEINIFTMGNNRIATAKALRNQVDAILGDKYKMYRSFSDSVANLADEDVYRYIVRYETKVTSEKMIYRR